MAENAGMVSLVTGASAGLGLEFARLLASDRCDVALVARREDRLAQIARELEETYGISAVVVAADLADRGAPGAILDAIEKAGKTVDCLVNNAGFGTSGAFAELPLERELDMIQVNVASLVELTGRVLPGMKNRGRGRILNIASTAGFQAGPYMATYYATKAFVVSFSEALHREAAGSGVSVTVSCPGATATEFGAVSGNGSSRLFEGAVATAEEVAREAYDAMNRGQRMVVHGFRNRMRMQSLRIAPRGVVHGIVARLNQTAE